MKVFLLSIHECLTKRYHTEMEHLFTNDYITSQTRLNVIDNEDPVWA